MAKQSISLPWLLLGAGVAVALVSPALTAQQRPAGDSVAEVNATSLDRLKKLGTALLMYAQDYGEVLPPMKDAATVKTMLLPYVRRDESVFVHPQTNEPYRPNPSVSRRRLSTVTIYPRSSAPSPRTAAQLRRMQRLAVKKRAQIARPAETVAFYEARPAADGTRGVLFLDGKAKRIPESEWPQLKRISRIP